MILQYLSILFINLHEHIKFQQVFSHSYCNVFILNNCVRWYDITIFHSSRRSPLLFITFVESKAQSLVQSIHMGHMALHYDDYSKPLLNCVGSLPTVWHKYLTVIKFYCLPLNKKSTDFNFSFMLDVVVIYNRFPSSLWILILRFYH